MAATFEELLSLREVGDKIAAMLLETMADANFMQEVAYFIELGVIPQHLQTEPIDGPLSGRRFLITGTLSSMSRSVAEKRIVELGGVIAPGVSATLTDLVVGDSPGSKVAKVEKLNAKRDEASRIRILDDAAFSKLIG